VDATEDASSQSPSVAAIPSNTHALISWTSQQLRCCCSNVTHKDSDEGDEGDDLFAEHQGCTCLRCHAVSASICL
jgi:hypothetical protein